MLIVFWFDNNIWCFFLYYNPVCLRHNTAINLPIHHDAQYYLYANTVIKKQSLKSTTNLECACMKTVIEFKIMIQFSLKFVPKCEINNIP